MTRAKIEYIDFNVIINTGNIRSTWVPLGSRAPILRESDARYLRCSHRRQEPELGSIAYVWEDEAPVDTACGGLDAGNVSHWRTRVRSVRARIPRAAWSRGT